MRICSCKFLFLISITLTSASNCPEFDKDDYRSGQRSPKTLISAPPHQIKVFGERNNSVIITGVGIQVRFDCWAPYPINIAFNGHLTNRGATVGLIERRVKDPEDLATYCFSINVTLTAYEEITGRYTCYAPALLNATFLRTSHYIYHAAHPPETLLNRNMAIRLMVDKRESFTTLPCPTSNPHVSVYLYKEVKRDLVEIEMDGTAIKYNPQKGFVVLTTLLLSDGPTRYRCATNLSDLDFVDIIVSPQPKLEIVGTPSHKMLIATEGEEIRVSCKASVDYHFENSNPEVKGETTFGIGPYEDSREHQYTTRKLMAGDAGLISCVSEAGETLFDWTYRTLKKENKSTTQNETLLQTPKLNSYQCKLPNGDMRVALYDCANWVECSLRRCDYLDRKCESMKCDDTQTSSCVKSGIIQCFDLNNKSAQAVVFFSGIKSRKIFTKWEAAPLHSILKISGNENFSKILSKSRPTEIELVCEGSAFVFAVGFKWYLIEANNSSKQIAVPQEHIQHKWKNLKLKNVIRSIAKMNVSNKISQIICKAPIWNSIEWKEDIINLTISQDHFLRSGFASSKLIGTSTQHLFALLLICLFSSIILFVK